MATFEEVFDTSDDVVAGLPSATVDPGLFKSVSEGDLSGIGQSLLSKAQSVGEFAGDVWTGVSDSTEALFQNEMEDRGITNVSRFEKLTGDITKSPQQQEEIYRQLYDEGVITDKFYQYQDEQRKKMEKMQKDSEAGLGWIDMEMKRLAVDKNQEDLQSKLADVYAGTNNEDIRYIISRKVQDSAQAYSDRRMQIMQAPEGFDKDKALAELDQFQSKYNAFFVDYAKEIARGVDPDDALDNAKAKHSANLAAFNEWQWKTEQDMFVKGTKNALEQFKSGEVFDGTVRALEGVLGGAANIGTQKIADWLGTDKITDKLGYDEILEGDGMLSRLGTKIENLGTATAYYLPEITETVAQMVGGGKLISGAAKAAGLGRAGAWGVAAEEIAEDLFIYNGLTSSMMGRPMTEDEVFENNIWTLAGATGIGWLHSKASAKQALLDGARQFGIYSKVTGMDDPLKMLQDMPLTDDLAKAIQSGNTAKIYSAMALTGMMGDGVRAIDNASEEITKAFSDYKTKFIDMVDKDTPRLKPIIFTAVDTAKKAAKDSILEEDIIDNALRGVNEMTNRAAAIDNVINIASSSATKNDGFIPATVVASMKESIEKMRTVNSPALSTIEGIINNSLVSDSTKNFIKGNLGFDVGLDVTREADMGEISKVYKDLERYGALELESNPDFGTNGFGRYAKAEDGTVRNIFTGATLSDDIKTVSYSSSLDGMVESIPTISKSQKSRLSKILNQIKKNPDVMLNQDGLRAVYSFLSSNMDVDSLKGVLSFDKKTGEVVLDLDAMTQEQFQKDLSEKLNTISSKSELKAFIDRTKWIDSAMDSIIKTGSTDDVIHDIKKVGNKNYKDVVDINSIVEDTARAFDFEKAIELDDGFDQFMLKKEIVENADIASTKLNNANIKDLLLDPEFKKMMGDIDKYLNSKIISLRFFDETSGSNVAGFVRKNPEDKIKELKLYTIGLINNVSSPTAFIHEISHILYGYLSEAERIELTNIYNIFRSKIDSLGFTQSQIDEVYALKNQDEFFAEMLTRSFIKESDRFSGNGVFEEVMRSLEDFDKKWYNKTFDKISAFLKRVYNIILKAIKKPNIKMADAGILLGEIAKYLPDNADEYFDNLTEMFRSGTKSDRIFYIDDMFERNRNIAKMEVLDTAKQSAENLFESLQKILSDKNLAEVLKTFPEDKRAVALSKIQELISESSSKKLSKNAPVKTQKVIDSLVQIQKKYPELRLDLDPVKLQKGSLGTDKIFIESAESVSPKQAKAVEDIFEGPAVTQQYANPEAIQDVIKKAEDLFSRPRQVTTGKASERLNTTTEKYIQVFENDLQMEIEQIKRLPLDSAQQKLDVAVKYQELADSFKKRMFLDYLNDESGKIWNYKNFQIRKFFNQKLLELNYLSHPEFIKSTDSLYEFSVKAYSNFKEDVAKAQAYPYELKLEDGVWSISPKKIYADMQEDIVRATAQMPITKRTAENTKKLLESKKPYTFVKYGGADMVISIHKGGDKRLINHVDDIMKDAGTDTFSIVRTATTSSPKKGFAKFTLKDNGVFVDLNKVMNGVVPNGLIYFNEGVLRRILKTEGDVVYSAPIKQYVERDMLSETLAMYPGARVISSAGSYGYVIARQNTELINAYLDGRIRTVDINFSRRGFDKLSRDTGEFLTNTVAIPTRDLALTRELLNKKMGVDIDLDAEFFFEGVVEKPSNVVSYNIDKINGVDVDDIDGKVVKKYFGMLDNSKLSTTGERFIANLNEISDKPFYRQALMRVLGSKIDSKRGIETLLIGENTKSSYLSHISSEFGYMLKDNVKQQIATMVDGMKGTASEIVDGLYTQLRKRGASQKQIKSAIAYASQYLPDTESLSKNFYWTTTFPTIDTYVAKMTSFKAMQLFGGGTDIIQNTQVFNRAVFDAYKVHTKFNLPSNIMTLKFLETLSNRGLLDEGIDLYSAINRISDVSQKSLTYMLQKAYKGLVDITDENFIAKGMAIINKITGELLPATGREVAGKASQSIEEIVTLNPSTLIEALKSAGFVKISLDVNKFLKSIPRPQYERLDSLIRRTKAGEVLADEWSKLLADIVTPDVSTGKSISFYGSVESFTKMLESDESRELRNILANQETVELGGGGFRNMRLQENTMEDILLDLNKTIDAYVDDVSEMYTIRSPKSIPVDGEWGKPIGDLPFNYKLQASAFDSTTDIPFWKRLPERTREVIVAFGNVDAKRLINDKLNILHTLSVAPDKIRELVKNIKMEFKFPNKIDPIKITADNYMSDSRNAMEAMTDYMAGIAEQHASTGVNKSGDPMIQFFIDGAETANYRQITLQQNPVWKDFMKRLDVNLNQPLNYQLIEVYEKLNSVLIQKNLFGSIAAMRGDTEYLKFLSDEDVPLAKIRDNIKRYIYNTFDGENFKLVRDSVERTPEEALKDSILRGHASANNRNILDKNISQIDKVLDVLFGETTQKLTERNLGINKRVNLFTKIRRLATRVSELAKIEGIGKRFSKLSDAQKTYFETMLNSVRTLAEETSTQFLGEEMFAKLQNIYLDFAKMIPGLESVRRVGDLNKREELASVMKSFGLDPTEKFPSNLEINVESYTPVFRVSSKRLNDLGEIETVSSGYAYGKTPVSTNMDEMDILRDMRPDGVSSYDELTLDNSSESLSDGYYTFSVRDVNTGNAKLFERGGRLLDDNFVEATYIGAAFESSPGKYLKKMDEKVLLQRAKEIEARLAKQKEWAGNLELDMVNEKLARDNFAKEQDPDVCPF